MKKSILRRAGAFLLSAAMMLGVVMPASALDRVSEGLPEAEEDYYVSVHQYIAPTEQDDIYRVTLSVKGKPPAPLQTRVAAVIDTSSSMNLNDAGQTYDSQSQFFNTWEISDSYQLWQMAAMYGTNMLATGPVTLTTTPVGLDDYPSLIHDNEILFPRGNSATQVEYNSGFFGATYTALRGAGIPAADGKAYDFWLPAGSPYPAWDSPISLTDFVVNGATTSNSTSGPGFYNSSVFDLDGAYAFDADLLPSYWVKPSDAPSKTRLGAAIDGAQSAADTFLTASSNPGALITSFGLVGFSSPDDTAEDPYFPATGGLSYGYGQDVGGAFAWEGWAPSITFSTRYNIVGVATTMAENSAFLAGWPITNLVWGAYTYDDPFTALVGTDLFKYMKSVAAMTAPTPLDDDMAKAYPKMTLTPVQDLIKDGMIPYDESGAGKNGLKSVLDKMIYASTGASQTEITDSLDEAAILLFGPENATSATALGAMANTADVATGRSTVDDIRRYIIFLSDGADTGNPAATFEKVNSLKAAGVEFMVIGIDTHGGDHAHEQQTTDANGYVIPAKGAVAPAPGGGGEHSQLLAWMGSRLVDYTAGFGGSWANVDAKYTGTTGGAYNYVPFSTNYTYIDPKEGDMTTQIEKAFADYVNKIINIGSDAKVSAQLNTEYFTVYQMPGKPRFAFTGNKGQKVIEKGTSWVWDHNGGLPLYDENTVTFYVKVNKDKMSDDKFADVLLKAEYTCIGQFPQKGKQPLQPYGVWPEIVMVKDVPVAAISPANGIKQESTEDDVKSSAMTYASDENKSSGTAIPIDTKVSVANSRAVPEITDVTSSKLKSGKTRVSVTVKNGKDMRYQWQKQKDDKGWEDIFGANTSVYTLGKGFTAGKKYTLRCVITNPAGDEFYSESIVVTATKSNVSSEKLQTSK